MGFQPVRLLQLKMQFVKIPLRNIFKIFNAHLLMYCHAVMNVLPNVYLSYYRGTLCEILPPRERT